MRRKYYYYIFIPIFCLIFGSSAFAATSSITTTLYTTDGEHYYTVGAYSYTGIYPTNVEEYTTNNNQHYQLAYYEIDVPIRITLTNDQYYNGYFTITLATSASATDGNASNTLIFDGAEVTSSNSDSISAYLTITGTSNRITVVMDNQKGTGSQIEVAHVKLRYSTTVYTSNAVSLTANFTNTISIQSSNFMQYDGVVNNALTAMIYSALEQGTQADFDTIISLLTDIRNQDYTYYNHLITALGLNGTLHNDNLQIYALLLGLDQHTQNGFAAVQTILDLFPSYRTQVLQYWQELLEMNAAQSSEAAALESEYADKDNQSSTLLSGLGSLNMPSISAGDVDIMANVDSTQKANFFGLISLITNNSLVTTILLIVVTGMIAGYILYGKK